MVAILDKHLNARFIEPTAAQIEAVSKLGQYDIHGFAKRLRTIAELAQGKSPKKGARQKA